MVTKKRSKRKAETRRVPAAGQGGGDKKPKPTYTFRDKDGRLIPIEKMVPGITIADYPNDTAFFVGQVFEHPGAETVRQVVLVQSSDGGLQLEDADTTGNIESILHKLGRMITVPELKERGHEHLVPVGHDFRVEAIQELIGYKITAAQRPNWDYHTIEKLPDSFLNNNRSSLLGEVARASTLLDDDSLRLLVALAWKLVCVDQGNADDTVDVIVARVKDKNAATNAA